MNTQESTTLKPVSPKKRYFLQMQELMRTDEQIASLMPKPDVWEAANQEGLSLDKLIATFLEGYGDRPALGHRAYEIKEKEGTSSKHRQYLPSYSTTSYLQLLNRIKGLANAWRHHPECQVAPNEFVATIGFTSLDFATIDFACVFAQAVTIPFQSSTSGADLGEIFANTEPVLLAATINDLELAAEHAIQQDSIRNVIAFNYDERDDDERTKYESAKKKLASATRKISLFTLDELIEYGNSFEWSFLPPHKDGADRMAAIIHSSGSTGKPKGAVLNEGTLVYNWTSRSSKLPRVTMLFAPLNHVMGRNAIVSILSIGGTAYFTLKADMSTLFEDIRLARPTYMVFFPRIFELIYQHYQNELTKRVRAGEGEKEAVGAKLQEEMRYTYLGDRLRCGIVGSAPTSPHVRDFMRDCFDILLMDGYGSTESGSGSITLDGIIDRASIVDYKLRDVPELGYYTTDKPFPRGELCIKSKFGITRYYKQPEATRGLFDEEGYSLTGDIVEERAPDHVVVIDRRKDVIKLSQGEYVAVGTLGTVFEAGSPAIKQIYIYGNSHRAYLLALIVPEMKVVKAALGSNPSEGKIKAFIRSEIHKVTQQEQLKTFEVPRDFLIEMEPFSQKNGLLSSVRKRLRPALKRKYGDQLEALYKTHDQVQEQELNALKDPNSKLSTLEKLTILLQNNLGVKDLDLSNNSTFLELGGDSLSAALLSMNIEEVFDVSIPANVILSPTSNPNRWVELIEKSLNNEIPQRPSFNLIHGKDSKTISSKDLKLERFIDADFLKTSNSNEVIQGAPKTVLLTGANGFLGHILCIDWLEDLASRSGKLICLVRAKDDQGAHLRLEKEFSQHDKDLYSKFQKLAEDHLEVIAGDISEAHFGLSEEKFMELAQSVDRICHPAALVNHRFAYPHLFGPNVLGTAEIIKLAMLKRKKPIDFISSVAVVPYLDKKSGNNERSPLMEQILLTDHYAAGYGVSKWAAEHLLQEASKDYNLSVNSFRCDMILAHEKYRGHINTADMFTRLLFSIQVTGLAPESFYKREENGSKAKAHYDGVPVNVVSEAVVKAYTQPQNGYKVFNVQNYLHEDGISLDSFVDWIESTGQAVNRIQDHDKWFSRFKDKLNTLPDSLKQHSALDILQAYARPYSNKIKSPECDNFKSHIMQIRGGKDIPNLSEAYIHKCLRDISQRGLLKK